ncbi:polysaccharide lyase [Spirosoma sp. KNUC1025]|uniref:polysaccharide lyase n=1 Tax=Spirosoma sp. KNUC1025 TaxID=2894082 RepID=UPI00386788D3|nr:polysaccharide lyase [Spirosoma sp. KNUC1025]
MLSLSSCTDSDTISPENITTAAAREDGSLLNIDTFEGSTFASFWWAQLWTKTAGYVSEEQHRAGKQAMRISWKPSQMNGTNDMLHSELLTRALPEGETERWYGYSSYFPAASMANDDQIAIVSQWHGTADPGFSDTVPPLCIEVQSNHLYLAYAASNKPIVKLLQSPTSSKRVDLGLAQFDRWVDYVVHVKWAPDGNTGQLQVWQNGTLILNEQNINIGYPQINKPYWKIGLYCWMGKNTYPEKVVYYDEVRIGGPTANYDVVKPGRDNGTALESDAKK